MSIDFIFDKQNSNAFRVLSSSRHCDEYLDNFIEVNWKVSFL